MSQQGRAAKEGSQQEVHTVPDLISEAPHHRPPQCDRARTWVTWTNFRFEKFKNQESMSRFSGSYPKMPTMGIMASRSRGIPLPQIDKRPCAYSRQSHTVFSDSILREFAQPHQPFLHVLDGNYSVGDLPFEVNGNSTQRWALGHSREWKYDF